MNTTSALDTDSSGDVDGSSLCELTMCIERTSIADAFDGCGPSDFFSVLFGSSALAEPTYGELVVAWRRAPSRGAAQLRDKARVGIPAILDAVDEDGDGRISLSEIKSAVVSARRIRDAVEDALDEEDALPPPPPLELRLFKQIPMANFEMVLPESKPEFALADWLRLDLVSSPALLTALAALQRYDGDVSALDVAALFAIVAWVVRTVFNYRNTLVRYELLLNRFLTEKLCIRDAGEVRIYAAREARKEQARRGATLLAMIREQTQPLNSEQILSLAAAKAAGAERVDFKPALAELQRLGLVQPCAEHGAEGLLESAPDGDHRLSEHWGRLLWSEGCEDCSSQL